MFEVSADFPEYIAFWNTICIFLRKALQEEKGMKKMQSVL